MILKQLHNADVDKWIKERHYRLGTCAGLYRCGMGNACGGTNAVVRSDEYGETI